MRESRCRRAEVLKLEDEKGMISAQGEIMKSLKTKELNRYYLYASILAIVIILDQVTKFLTRYFLDIGESKSLLPFLAFTHAQNTGASFSILYGQNLLLTILAIIVLLIVGYIFYKEKSTKTRTVLALFCAGLIGNLIDRLIFGSVTDFIDFKIWPIFNIADSAITLSVIALIYLSVRERRKS